MSSVPPDVLVIVMDAVRGDAVYADWNGTIDLPFLKDFSRSAAVFPEAVAPATWTLPSVASLMTGLYPWNHRVSALEASYLDDRVPTLATFLRGAGYRTVLMSANLVVGPRTNLSSGFQSVYYPVWWEQYIRNRQTRPQTIGVVPSNEEAARAPTGKSLGSSLRKGMRIAFRQPRTIELANEVSQRLRNGTGGTTLDVCSWIEPTFADLLEQTPHKQPLAVVLHLNDAHEPYLRALGVAAPASHRQMARQDYMQVIEGRWRPSPDELAILRQLYLDSVARLDSRLKRLLGIFSEHRDLDHALTVITADHGQSLGEGGWLFHMSSSEEAVLRIPLIVRFPGRELTGVASGWASLIDVVPTVLEGAGLPSALTVEGCSLRSLQNSDRPTPVWALGDGLPLDHLQGIVMTQETSVRRAAAHHWLAAYLGPSKSICDLDSQELRVERAEIPATTEARAPSTTSSQSSDQVLAEARRIGDILRHHRMERESATVTQRLESWGYGV